MSLSQSIHSVLYFRVTLFYLIETSLVSSRIIHLNWNRWSFSVSQQFRRGDLNGHICHMCNLIQLKTIEVSGQITDRLARKFTHNIFSSGNSIFLIVILRGRNHYLSNKSRRYNSSAVGDKFCGNLIHFLNEFRVDLLFNCVHIIWLS